MPGTFGSLFGLVILVGVFFGPVVWVAVVVPDFGVLLFAGLWALVGAVLLLVRVPRHMELDCDRDRWVSQTASLGFMLPRSQTLRLEDIERLELERGFSAHKRREERGQPEGEAKPLVFRLTAFGRDDVELARWRMSVDDHVTLDHGVQLLERFADVIGLAPVDVISRDALRLEARASRRLDPGGGSVAPVAREPSPSTPGTGFRPEHDLPQLGFEITAWAPGGEIRFAKPFHLKSIGLYPVITTGAVALLASLQVWPSSRELLPPLPFDLAEPGLLVVAIPVWCIALGGTFVMWRINRRFGVVVDWPYRRLRIRRGDDTLEVPFARLETLELRGIVSEVTVSRRTRHGQSQTRTVYALMLVARVSRPDRAIELVRTDTTTSSGDERAYEYMYGLTERLAEALEIPFRFRDFAWEETYGDVE
jgi:hypothetical protein